MNIKIFFARYGLSGVPIAQMRLAESLSKKGHNVEVIIGHCNENFHIPNTTLYKIKVLKKKRVIKILPFLIKEFFYKKIDLIFSAGDHLNAIVLIAAIISMTKSRICCSSRVTPYDTYSDYIFSKGWVLKHIMKIVSRRANLLTCVSKDMVLQYEKIFKKTSHKCIYNIIDINNLKNKMLEPIEINNFKKSDEKLIIAAGMLERWKGFDDLIKAFKILTQKNKVKLLIIGDGSQKEYLLNLSKDLNIENLVIFLGNINNPYKFFFNSDVFALTSHVEGMPNVLIEAMVCGCTPVATNCETGPSEIITNDNFGYLVEVKNIQSIYKGLENAILNPISKQNLALATKQFSEEQVLNNYSVNLNLKEL